MRAPRPVPTRARPLETSRTEFAAGLAGGRVEAVDVAARGAGDEHRAARHQAERDAAEDRGCDDPLAPRGGRQAEGELEAQRLLGEGDRLRRRCPVRGGGGDLPRTAGQLPGRGVGLELLPANVGVVFREISTPRRSARGGPSWTVRLPMASGRCGSMGGLGASSTTGGAFTSATVNGTSSGSPGPWTRAVHSPASRGSGSASSAGLSSSGSWASRASETEVTAGGGLQAAGDQRGRGGGELAGEQLAVVGRGCPGGQVALPQERGVGQLAGGLAGHAGVEEVARGGGVAGEGLVLASGRDVLAGGVGGAGGGRSRVGGRGREERRRVAR
jgi:hypothetical protein